VRAARISQLDGPEAMTVDEIDEPTGDVVIDVVAAGIAFPDALQSRGLYQLKPPVPFVPGSEVAGTVRSAPADSGLTVGQRVAAFPMLGGFAEVVAVGADLVFPIPDSLSFEKAAALPMNYLTVLFALQERYRLEAGQTVLVHGAAGGIGTATIQVARAMGATVIAVASTEEKIAVATAAGAHHAILADGFLAATKELTEGRGVDLVVDPVGGDRFTDSLRSLAEGGSLLVLGFTGGEIPTVRVNRLLLNNISVVGVGWGAFWSKRPGYLQQQWRDLLPMIESGAVDPPLAEQYPLERAGEAVAVLENRGALGKILLTM
jgi:NADPH2:quinone reductase